MSTDTSSRFLTLGQVAVELGVSRSQAYALVRRGDVPAIKVGGRGQWRVERTELETYIQNAYTSSREFIAEHPFGEASDGPVDFD